MLGVFAAGLVVCEDIEATRSQVRRAGAKDEH